MTWCFDLRFLRKASGRRKEEEVEEVQKKEKRVQKSALQPSPDSLQLSFYLFINTDFHIKMASTAWQGGEGREGVDWGNTLLAPRDCFITIIGMDSVALPSLPQEFLQ